MTGTTLGNLVTESYGYDSNRMQLTSQTATQSGGPANGLMNLTYGYQASAGQMGAGTTAGNAGQLMSISGTIGGVTESAAYTYDDLGRLVTSNQTSNASIAQRRFAYDRWGNRTGMWDATSGGNQIQSIALQQSGGAPTNRITSVTSGSTVNYSYDAAGNVTNDGVHSYGYDSENRIVSVDGGSTASYAYDNENRRHKKTIGATVTHYVWGSSQVIAEHNGSTGAVLIDYVYSGSRMIAKVASGTTQYFLSDRLSVRLSLDSSGNITGRQGHLPFGEDFGESGTQEKHHFTSYETDPETSSDYAINRQYIQNVGRFMRVDPKAGSASSPVSLNRYSYVINDPINASDPFGLEYDPVNCWSISFLNPEVFYICGPREDLKGIGGGGATNGDPRTGGGGQVGTPAPLPDNLRARLRRLMQKNNNECGNFIQNLINQVASDTNRPLYSDYFMDLFDRIAGPEGGGYVVEPVVINGRSAGGSVRGDMGNAPTVLISPVPYSGYADDSYTHTAVHETIHLAPTQGWYLDGQLANAAFKLEGANLSQAEKDEYAQIEGDEWKASGFWDKILWKHCK